MSAFKIVLVKVQNIIFQKRISPALTIFFKVESNERKKRETREGVKAKQKYIYTVAYSLALLFAL